VADATVRVPDLTDTGGSNVASYLRDATDTRMPGHDDLVMRLPLPGEPADSRFPLRDGLAYVFERYLDTNRDMVPDPPASWVGDRIYHVKMGRHEIDQAAVESQAIDGKPWPDTLIFGDREEALAWARTIAAAVVLCTDEGTHDMRRWSAGSRRIDRFPVWEGDADSE
jgi:hypothetical protein